MQRVRAPLSIFPHLRSACISRVDCLLSGEHERWAARAGRRGREVTLQGTANYTGMSRVSSPGARPALIGWMAGARGIRLQGRGSVQPPPGGRAAVPSGAGLARWAGRPLMWRVFAFASLDIPAAPQGPGLATPDPATPCRMWAPAPSPAPAHPSPPQSARARPPALGRPSPPRARHQHTATGRGSLKE